MPQLTARELIYQNMKFESQGYQEYPRAIQIGPAPAAGEHPQMVIVNNEEEEAKVRDGISLTADEDEKERLIQLAESRANVKIDRRWGVERLRRELGED